MKANTQLKLLFYIAAIAFFFYYLHGRYGIFDIEFVENLRNEKVEEDKKSEVATYPVIIIENNKGVPVQLTVEVATTEEEKKTGLMDRSTLGDYSGMIFVYENNTQSTFWMKNVSLPLDIIFLNSYGRIVDIVQEAQPCEEDPCQVYSSSEQYRYAVEVNGGWSEANYVEVGNLFDLKEIQD